MLAIAFLAINYDLTIASTLIIFVVFTFAMYTLIPARLTHNSKPNNTFTAIGYGIGGVIVILLISMVLTTLFQGLLQTTVEPSLNSIMNSGFSSLAIDRIVPQSSQPVFAGSILLMIFTFGIVIATVETRMIGRAMEWLAKIFNVDLNKPFYRDIKVLAIFFLISGLFVWYHGTAKGVVDNVALMLTFIFAFISMEMIRRTGELEGATYLHIFNNLLYITQVVGFGS